MKSLSFDCTPIEQPAAVDPIERSTWCELRIKAGSEAPLSFFDKSLGATRDHLFVPAFPIAEWLARNWWSLFNESCPGEKVPTPPFDAETFAWTKRHCLRGADSSLLLPSLTIYHDGRRLCADLNADPRGSLPNMPGEFHQGFTGMLDEAESHRSLSAFIERTIDRLKSVLDERVDALTAQWRAIRNADDDERRFCKIAGRMGLDPYDPSVTSEELADFIETAFPDPDAPLVQDLTES
ncbi:MAG: hypothetical protein ACRDD1_12085, partial [Planctomycetia bacterium]